MDRLKQGGFYLLKSHALCQLQDLGRFGVAGLGLTEGGACDQQSAMLANMLLGNVAGAPLLEIGVGGVSLRAQANTYISLTGAQMPFLINGQPAPRYCTIAVQSGDLIEIGYARAGLRCYLAVAGGFLVPTTLGSVSTVLREGVGGLNGGALADGDWLAVHPCEAIALRSLPYESQPKFSAVTALDWIAGAQYDWFSQEAITRLDQQLFRVTKQSDRMGCRLSGGKIKVKPQAQMYSEGVCCGAIQISNDGQPIVMLNDHQTIGGYAKPGAVSRLSLNALAQCRPGSLVRFVKRDLCDVQAKAARQREWLARLQQEWQHKA
jgi:allophanate hydrolase